MYETKTGVMSLDILGATLLVCGDYNMQFVLLLSGRTVVQ